MKDRLMLVSGHYPIAKAGNEALWLIRDHEDREIRNDSTFLCVKRLEDKVFQIRKLHCGSASEWYEEAKSRNDFVLM